MAKNQLKKVSDTLTDMELDNDFKLKMATRLINKSATTWWKNLKLRTLTSITWGMFMQKFNEQFYTQFHRDQKRQKFFRLKQFDKIVIEYETELRELAEFVLEMANSKEYLCLKFEKGLTFKIRKKIYVLGSQSCKEVVQLVLRAKKLISEKVS